MAISNWIAVALLVLCTGEACLIRHLYAHRVIHIDLTSPAALQLSPMEIHADPYAEDYGVVHAFPEKREVCTSFDTICWVRI